MNWAYKKGRFYCEGVSIDKIAKETGTPFYLYSYNQLVENFNRFNQALRSLNHLVCFAFKSNSNLTIGKILARQGAGVDVISGGELYQALLANFKPKKIVFAGVGKTEEEIEYALKKDILLLNVESLNELKKIEKIAKRINKSTCLSFRINPNIKVRTHSHVTTGLAHNKFGLSSEELKEAINFIRKQVRLKLVGLHAHIGSQICEISPFVLSTRYLVELAKNLELKGIKIKYINVGGGLGIRYKNENPPTPEEYAQKLISVIKEFNAQQKYIFIFEPGRYIVATAGVLITKVLYLKQSKTKSFIVVDAGMNDLIRPSLYDAYHEIIPVKQTKRRKVVVDVVGPICESGDYFARNRKIRLVNEGEFLSLLWTGAYGFSMGSNYNSRLSIVEVMVKGNKYCLIRQRGNYKDLIYRQSLKNFLI